MVKPSYEHIICYGLKIRSMTMWNTMSVVSVSVSTWCLSEWGHARVHCLCLQGGSSKHHTSTCQTDTHYATHRVCDVRVCGHTMYMWFVLLGVKVPVSRDPSTYLCRGTLQLTCEAEESGTATSQQRPPQHTSGRHCASTDSLQNHPTRRPVSHF